MILLIITFVVFSLLFLQITPGIYEKSVFQTSVSQSQVVNKASLGFPVRLKIPSINVNATIQHVGLTPKREMEVPSNIVDVGWFKPGVLPGEKGSAVIAGHLNGENGEAGVFTNLNKLKPGDKLYVEDNKGATTVFVVSKSRIYDSGFADEVFSKRDGTHLNLITCDGIWDGAKKSYNKRLVVFADAY
ncbi:MAG: class F sortase [Candidatus Daviesbacteria bacterium]|nr:class F sortase [Candidatus Daviesbacteria bacterium]